MNVVEDLNDKRASEPDRREQSAGRRRTILLVEDNEQDRQMYGGLLWYNGFDVVEAVDGESAVARGLELRPDLILLDIILPGEMTGLDVATRLREGGVTAPMLVLSAVPREDLGSAVERAGVTAYLEKPIDPFAVVREVIRRIGGPSSE